MKTKRTFIAVVAMLLVCLLIAACAPVTPTADTAPAAEESAVAEETAAAEEPAAEEPAAEEPATEEAADAAAAVDYDPSIYDGKLAWYFPFAHTYGNMCAEGVDAYIAETGVQVNKVIGPEYTMQSEMERVEALSAQGYEKFAIWPVDSGAVSGLYEELVSQGNQVFNFGVDSTEHEYPLFMLGTDQYSTMCAMIEDLITRMGGKGNLLVGFNTNQDASFVDRKKALDDTVAKYPEITVVEELNEMLTEEDAQVKMGDAISKYADGELQGILAPDPIVAHAAISALEERYTKSETKVYLATMEIDDVISGAIKDGIVDVTYQQNPYGTGYLSCEILRLLYDGWTPVEGQYLISTGYVPVTTENVDNFQPDLEALTDTIMSELTTKYMEKK